MNEPVDTSRPLQSWRLLMAELAVHVAAIVQDPFSDAHFTADQFDDMAEDLWHRVQEAVAMLDDPVPPSTRVFFDIAAAASLLTYETSDPDIPDKHRDHRPTLNVDLAIERGYLPQRPRENR